MEKQKLLNKREKKFSDAIAYIKANCQDFGFSFTSTYQNYQCIKLVLERDITLRLSDNLERLGWTRKGDNNASKEHASSK